MFENTFCRPFWVPHSVVLPDLASSRFQGNFSTIDATASAIVRRPRTCERTVDPVLGKEPKKFDDMVGSRNTVVCVGKIQSMVRSLTRLRKVEDSRIQAGQIVETES
jgi:hypothetical protein